MKVRPALRRELNWSCLTRKFCQATWFTICDWNNTCLWVGVKLTDMGKGNCLLSGMWLRSQGWAPLITHLSQLTVKLSDFSYEVYSMVLRQIISLCSYCLPNNSTGFRPCAICLDITLQLSQATVSWPTAALAFAGLTMAYCTLASRNEYVHSRRLYS